jgi:hypothetical protein
MQEKSYSFVQIRSEVRYEFVSVSAEKEVKKVVTFVPTEIDNVYNLALLDELPDGTTSDTTETKNNDMITVLATVIKIIDDFLDKDNNALVFFQGSDERRQRLYQIVISRELDEIQKQFWVFGGNDSTPEPFVKNKNYEFFLISKLKIR